MFFYLLTYKHLFYEKHVFKKARLLTALISSIMIAIPALVFADPINDAVKEWAKKNCTTNTALDCYYDILDSEGADIGGGVTRGSNKK